MFFSETLNDAAEYHAILLTKLVGELLCERYREPLGEGREGSYTRKETTLTISLIRISSYKYSSLLSGGKRNGPAL